MHIYTHISFYVTCDQERLVVGLRTKSNVVKSSSSNTGRHVSTSDAKNSYVAACCGVLRCVAVCCSALQCVAVRSRHIQKW